MIYALGAFDGFHLGHRKLLDRARAAAETKGVGWGVLTFENHPQTLFNRDKFKLLFTGKERDLIASYLGVRRIVKLAFDRMLADMTAEDFVDFAGARNNVSGLVVGSNFRFGRGRTGTPAELAALCTGRGWSLDVVTPYEIDGLAVSSSVIREFLIRGQIERGVRFLGYPFLVSGRVVKGDGRGGKIGFATANLAVSHRKVYPAKGSYAAYVFIEKEWRPVALNIGFNPTFDLAGKLRCEAHIIDFDGDLYSKELNLFVFAKNRDEVKFAGEGALRTQLIKDMENIKYLSLTYMKNNKKIFSGFGQAFVRTGVLT